MGLFTYLRENTEKSDWIEGSYLVIYNLFFGLMPIWATWIILWLIKQNEIANGIIDQGELGIYSASTMGAVIYLSTKSRGRRSKSLRQLINKRDGPLPVEYSFPGRQEFSIASVFLIIISMIFFLIATMSNFPNPPFTLVKNFNWGMIIIAFFATIVSYLTGVVDNTLEPTSDAEISNLIQARSNDYSNFVKDFDNLPKQ